MQSRGRQKKRAGAGQTDPKAPGPFCDRPALRKPSAPGERLVDPVELLSREQQYRIRSSKRRGLETLEMQTHPFPRSIASALHGWANLLDAMLCLGQADDVAVGFLLLEERGRGAVRLR